MNKSKKTIFVSIIWGYPRYFYNLAFEENYHLHALKVAKDNGFLPYIIIKGSKKNIEEDPHFDSDITVIDYKNFLQFLLLVVKFSFKNSVFYVNSYEWQSFVVPFFARRTIFMAHTQPKRKTKTKQIIQNFVYKFFSAIRLNNEDEKNFLMAQGISEKKLFVVPLVVSQGIFTLDTIHNERSGLVYFGNVTPIKNLLTILKALKKVLVENPSVKLHIVGKIFDDNFLKDVSALDLEKSVIVHGYIPQGVSLSNFLNTMLISINSSIFEGQCVAVYDSALCGCVLCLPRIMSFMGVFKDKALFHDVYDYEQLAKNILFYLENPAVVEKNRSMCIQMILENYSIKTVETRLKNLFSSV